MSHIAILGAGSWGTAIAKHLSDKGERVVLWARRPELASEIASRRENARYLPGIPLPEALRITSDLAQALRGASMVLFVVPSHGLRELARQAAPLIEPAAIVVSASKGIENESLMLMTDVLAHELAPAARGRICALGGPSFAREVAQGVPTAISVAGRDHDVACAAQERLAGERFRVYTSDDVLGVELGGALKNVIAIAVGAADGLGFGHNARAALITRGVAEIARLGARMGAHPQTLAGLSGMGDLVLTCTGDLSRNRQVGIELGRGRSLQQVLAAMSMVAEGVRTAKSAYHLAQREDVDMPITTEVYRALYEGTTPEMAVNSLLSRSLKPERD